MNHLSQPELAVAIFEVAQCFLHGWGICKVSRISVRFSFRSMIPRKDEFTLDLHPLILLGTLLTPP